MRLIKRERGGPAGIETGTIPASNNRDLTKAKKAAGTGGTVSQVVSLTNRFTKFLPCCQFLLQQNCQDQILFIFQHLGNFGRTNEILAGIPRKQFLQLNPSQIYNQLGECNKIHNLRVNDVNNSEIYKHAQQEFAAADAQPEQ
jgi:hypothetical protein